MSIPPHQPSFAGIGHYQPGAIVIRPGAAQCVLWSSGEHDVATSTDLGAALAAAGTTDVVVDLEGVTFMDAATVRELIVGRLRASATSKWWSVRSPSCCARRVLELCELTALIEPAKAAIDTAAPPERGQR